MGCISTGAAQRYLVPHPEVIRAGGEGPGSEKLKRRLEGGCGLVGLYMKDAPTTGGMHPLPPGIS